MLARDFDRMADDLLEALKHPLTGLLNHRAFQERLGEDLRRAEREGYAVSLVAIDIDDFEVIDDGQGHAVGDEALRLLAGAINRELRASDICGRVGGDEFMLATVKADAEVAERIVARVRAEVEAQRVGQAEGGITISAGIATFPLHSLAQEELYHLADGAMYWAKSHGKSRTFVYSSEIDFALSPEDAAERNLRAGLVNTVHALAALSTRRTGTRTLTPCASHVMPRRLPSSSASRASGWS